MNLNKTIAFHTLGCKVNQYETESIKNQLIELGYREEKFENKADIYLVNSCTVTSIADKKTRNILRRAKNLNPNSIVIVTGCYAQTNSDDLAKIEEIDYIVGNSNKVELVDFIKNIETKKNKILTTNIFENDTYEKYSFATLREMSRAYIKIQDGCNNFCSYCKIPFGRGKSRSRNFESIKEEIKTLVLEGFHEFILIGINLGAYGEDLDENIDFDSMLEKIVEIDGVERVRIGSMYPDKISDKFIDLISNNKKIMPHLHISLQSCDDTILEKMRRKYNSSLILDKLIILKEKVNSLEFTADVIVGFPGETDEMFNNTKKIIEKISFSDLHTFQYSDRENTLASTFENKIDNTVKKKRVNELNELRNKMTKQRLSKYVGETLEVLVETTKDSISYGYSENYLRVKILNSDSDVNKIIKVNILNIEKELLIGKEIK